MPNSEPKVPVSILIPVKNEAANLPRCLLSITWADEIIVVDSQSTDESGKIAEEFGAKIVQFHFSGTWPKKKNWALENLDFRNEWVFILDADEVLPPEAKDEIAAIAGAGGARPGGGNQPVGYWINRRFFFMGKWLRHAYFPNWNLRLFRRRLGRYEKLTDTDTASGDNEVHEHVIVQGKTGKLKCVMDHYAFPTVSAFVEKHNRYSSWEAAVDLAPSATNSMAPYAGAMPWWRRQVKLISRHVPFRPLLRFLYVYVWQRGFLDGIEGYYFARLHAEYELLILAKTFELRRELRATTSK